MMRPPPYRYRSLVFPAILILAGLLALLVNTGAFSIDRVVLLVQLWPLILIVIGAELIVRRYVSGPAGEVATAVVVLVAIAGAAAYVALGPNPAATSSLDSSAGLGEATAASLELDVGTATVTLSGSLDLGKDLYRAHLRYPGNRPEISVDRSTGSVRIAQNNNNPFGVQAGRFVIDMQLNQSIPWSITENSGATNDTWDLSHVKVGEIRVNTGASKEVFSLGPESGIVPVRVDGGALSVHITRPAGTQVSASVSGGLVDLTADGHAFRSIGSVSYSPSDLGGDYYQLQINGGTCSVTVDSAA